MNALKDIQTLARDTISAFDGNYFANDLVVANTGNSYTAIEDALNNRGFVVEIPLPQRILVRERAPGVSEAEVDFFVMVKVNPQRNGEASGAGVNVLEAVDNVFSALLRYDTGNETDRFETLDEAAELIVDDPGLTEYALAFRAFAVLS